MKMIIDGPYLAHRSFKAPYKLTTSTGLDSTLIFTFLKSLKLLKRKYCPSSVILTWESHGTPSWRRDLLPTYKPHKKVCEDYLVQLEDLQVYLDNMNVPQYYSPTNEADDVIATLLKDEPTLIFTIDKDIMQLIDDRIPIGVIVKHELFREKEFVRKFNIQPKQMPDYLALVGDKSDNIKGVVGIGKVKSTKLLAKYKIADLIPLTPKQRKIVELNQKLTRLNHNCKLVKKEFCDKMTNEEILEKYEIKEVPISKI